MVGPSKILTVSYGTFSCTLEGFDEPFTTMKAIAEYFRDLAADDRYFGAEPPVPDAEMLQRIAEREIQRRVETKISEMGVVLRQTSTDAATAPLAVVPPAVAPIAAVVAVAPVAVAEVDATEVASEPTPEPVAVATPVVPAIEPVADLEPATETVPVAAIMAALDAAPVIEAAPAPVEEAAELVEDTPEAATPVAAEATADAPTYAPELVADEAYEASLDDIMAETTGFVAEDMAEIAAVEAPAIVAYDAAEADLEDDSIAAKLMRIRAVVEAERGTPLPAFEAEEELEARTFATEPVAADFGFDVDLGPDMPDQRVADAVAHDDMATAASDMGFEDEPMPSAPMDDSNTLAAAFAQEDASSAEDDALMAQLASMSAASVEDHAEADRAVEPAPEPVVEAPYADLAATADTEDADGDHEEMEFEPRPSFFQRARARVLRLGKAAPREEHEEAQTELEVDSASGFVEVEPEADFAMADETPASADAEPDADADLSRLMEEARSKLEGAESRRRFSAISHLKAAVAATLADRKLATPEAPTQPEIEKAEELSLYREDLSKVVRPRRPTADAQHGTPRPEIDMRPAPLVLVSEQRIDRQENTQGLASAIRPRRMAATNLAMFAEDADADEDEVDLSPESASSFADFAERMGATDLTELLEAAAAYTASVEGHSHFSRPQLLRKVEFVSSRGGYNREDGLRSFGMLLRQGKIQKVSPGQFTLADGSKFTEEARRAAL